jgi:hypothetical protein
MVKVARIVPHFTTFLLATKFDSDLVEQDVSKKRFGKPVNMSAERN